jgi:hypothetical protein
MRVVDRDSLARRIMTPDYEYWRARTSPEEARAIRVFMADRAVNLTCGTPAVRRVVALAFSKVDWAALYALLDEPR